MSVATNTMKPIDTPGQTLDAIKWGQARKANPGQRIADHIVCRDGYVVSVQASDMHYSHDQGQDAPYWRGVNPPPAVLPWRSFEVQPRKGGRPEPWRCTAWHEGFDRHEDHPVCDGWEAQSGDGSEYGPFAWVPESVVRALIDLHGGEQT